MTLFEQPIELDTVVVVVENQVSADLRSGIAGELVVLELDGGTYYELNEVGAFVWRAIQEPTSVRAVLGSLQATYDVPEDECKTDLISLLARLQAKQLIAVRNA